MVKWYNDCMKYIWYIIIIALLVLIYFAIVADIILENWDFEKPPKPVKNTNMGESIRPRPEEIPNSEIYGWDDFEEHGKL